MTQQLLAPALPGISRADVEALSRDEPQWLRERRLDAWRTYEAMDFPDPSDEEWRRTDVRAIDLTDYLPSVTRARLRSEQSAKLQNVPKSNLRASLRGGGHFDWRTDSRELLFGAGGAHAYRQDFMDDVSGRGVLVKSLSLAATEHEDIVSRRLCSIVPDDEWKYLALNAALWTGWFIYVPRDVEIELPLRILDSAMDGSDPQAVFPRRLIVIEKNSRVVLVDETQSMRPSPCTFVSGAVELFIGDGAQVEYYNINRWGDNVYNFNTVRATLGRDAQFTALVAGIGSKLTKMRIDTLMPEPGARAELLGVTFGDGDQHFDYNTRQEHTGAHTISDLQFKSALTDSASLVWYGVTRINPGASASEANQTSRNLLLSEHAKAAPIPILEIEAYDVAKCSHGATAGPVEETELFYLESRGIEKSVAEHMLVEGFFANVIDRIPNETLRARVLEAVLEKAAGRAGALTFDEVLAAK